MLRILISVILVLGARIAMAQDFSGEAIQKMKEFEFLQGNWEGSGWVVTPAGREESSVKEFAAYEAGGTVMMLRGKGFKVEDGAEKIVHDAVGVLYYDVFEKKYKLHSFISRGMNTVANVEILDQGKFKWWFSAGPNTIQYTLSYENDTWTEIGEMIDPTGTSRQFFSMQLKRK